MPRRTYRIDRLETRLTLFAGDLDPTFSGDGIAEIAPLEGFLHPRSTLDTLGYDAPESACKAA